jgi:branched-subunit amino acid aminotransferase/4-amino-4-deoxychorismate lyase
MSGLLGEASPARFLGSRSEEVMKAIFNGDLIDSKDAVVPVTSRAVQCNFSVYEALRVIGGHVVGLDAHMQRLSQSASMIGLKLTFPVQEIASWVFRLLEAEGLEEATLRILVIGEAPNLCFITATKMLSYPDSYYTEGVKATVYDGERFLPKCKTSNLLLSYLALEDSKAQGGFEAILRNRDGLLLEGTRSNFYVYQDNVIRTAGLDHVLDGVTRQSVFRACSILGWPIIEKPVSLQEAFQAQGAFISSTSMAAMPLASLGEKVFEKDFSRTLRICSMIRAWEQEERTR